MSARAWNQLIYPNPIGTFALRFDPIEGLGLSPPVTFLQNLSNEIKFHKARVVFLRTWSASKIDHALTLVPTARVDAEPDPTVNQQGTIRLLAFDH